MPQSNSGIRSSFAEGSRYAMAKLRGYWLRRKDTALIDRSLQSRRAQPRRALRNLQQPSAASSSSPSFSHPPPWALRLRAHRHAFRVRVSLYSNARESLAARRKLLGFSAEKTIIFGPQSLSIFAKPKPLFSTLSASLKRSSNPTLRPGRSGPIDLVKT